MKSPTQKLIAPVSKVEIEIRDWITGSQAEYIDEALLMGVDMKPDMKTKSASFEKFDVKAINEETHREIEKFIVSVNGETKDILKIVGDLPADDYNFIKKEINTRRKKKVLD